MVAALLAVLLTSTHDDALAAQAKLEQLGEQHDYLAMEQLVGELSKRDWRSEPRLSNLLTALERDLAYRHCDQSEIGRGRCYRDWASRWPKEQLAPEALFNAMIAFSREQDFEAVVEAAAALEQGYPMSPLTPRAMFLSSRVLGELGREEEQAALGERLGTLWPIDRDANDGLFNAMVVRARLRQCAKAKQDAAKVAARAAKGSADALAASRVIERCR
ncbi:MAG: hypothetical protein QM723_03410 [Myxococcaceae bacterium]